MMDDKTDQPGTSAMEFNTIELPPSIDIKESSIRAGEAGAFAKELIAKDTRFGPYKGEIIDAGVKKYIDYRFAWEVLEKRSNVLRHTISAMDTKLSNWMRHVNCARFYEEQNILSVQDGFSIYYVAMKDIKPGEELLTWFDPKLLKRTKRRLSKMARKPVGYTIELVPWSDEKKFVPEIIETKRARKKKVLSDMISLDENPMAITRTLQSLPKVPCTPRQLAQSATYRHLFASLIENAESSPKSDSRKSKDKSGKKPKADPVVIYSQQNKTNTKTNKVGSQTSDSSSAWKDVKNTVSASCLNKMAHTSKTDSLTATQLQDEKVLKSGPPVPEKNTVSRSKPRKRRRSTRDDNLAVAEQMALKPIVFKSNDDGSMSVEDHDESFLLKDMEFRAECDDQCPCLNKQEAMKSHDLSIPDQQTSFVIHFTLLPEHKTLSPNNKVLYRCDICGSAYNHAFSLKRHYLGIHINHRYLTPGDIQSCQIQTFHIGAQLQICSPKYPKPVATDLNSEHAVVETLSATTGAGNTETCDIKSLSRIPSLKQLAKLVMEQTKTKSNTTTVTNELDSTDPASYLETLDKTIQDKNVLILRFKDKPSLVKLLSDNEKLDSCSVDISSHLESDTSKVSVQADKTCLTLEGKDMMCAESSLTMYAECTVNNMKECSVDNESYKKSDMSVIAVEESPSAIGTVAKLPETSDQIVRSDKVEELLGDAVNQGHAVEVNAASVSPNTNYPLKLSRDRNHSLVLEPCLSHEVQCDSNYSNPQTVHTLKPKSDIEISLGHKSVCENSSSSLQENVNTQLAMQNEYQNKSENNDTETNNSNCSIKKKDVFDDGNTESEMSSATLPLEDQHTESVSSCVEQLPEKAVLSSISDLNTHSSPASLSSIPQLVNSRQPQTPSFPRETNNPAPLPELCPSSSCDSSQTVVSSGPVACTEDISSTLGSSTALSVSVGAPSMPNSLSVPSVSSAVTLVKSPSSSDISTSANSTAVAISAKNSSPKTPQVIFVTNIVFPIMTPSHKALATSAQSSTTPAQALTTACLAKTLTKGNQSTGVPLVLISPITGGISSTNTFLQSSTALKTIQTLQNSLNVMSLGKAPTVITGTKGSSPTMSTGVSSMTGTTKSGTGPTSVALQVRSPVTPVTSLPSSMSSPCVTPVIAQQQTPAISQDNGSGQPEDLYRCHMCVLLFKTMTQLKNHIKNDPHRFKGCIKQYACLQCSVRFSNKANLIRHNLMNHQEEGNHKHRCFTCGKGFSTETYLKMHARFHSGKNFPCKYGCVDVVFPNAASLVKHLRSQHAGLDLKEYLKNVKPRDRKRRDRVKTPSHPVAVVQNNGKNTEYKIPAPYSMMQPGVGFQAKRMKPKSSRETATNVIKTEPSTDEEKSADSNFTDIKDEENVAPETQNLLFKCKMCLKGFSTHLRLLQHRTLKHGASQSVQEYLYQMSKDIYEDEYSEYDSVKSEDISPPASPKTFFSNVNRKGYENMKHYIDGGAESLKNWRKYLKVEGYISIAEPALPADTAGSTIEWTCYNFPPTFVYKSDCTEFYNEGIKQEKGASVTTMNDSCDVPEGIHAASTTVHSDTEQMTVIKKEAEDISYGMVSQERANDIIFRLEQRLQASQDSSDASENKKNPPLTIKAEIEDSSYGDTSLNKTNKHSNTSENDRIPKSLTLSSEYSELVSSDDLENHGSDHNVQETPINVNTNDSAESEMKKATVCRLDSGFSSMSSSESPSIDSYETDAKVSDTDFCEVNLVGPCDETLQNSLSGRKHSDVSSVSLLHTSTPAKREYKRNILPNFPLQEKLEALESYNIQGINLESNYSHSVKSEVSASKVIDSLNLHITGCQLLSSKITKILEKYRSSNLYPGIQIKRQRTLSLPPLGLVSPSKRTHHSFESTVGESLNTSDYSKHDHRRYSIWTGQMHQKVLKEAGESTFCCPVVETVKKQETIRLREQYMYEKASRDREDDGKRSKKKKSVLEKIEFARTMGLMERKEFEISHHAKKLEEHIIKPPEIWKNYENIWFGKKGSVAVVCSICHRHFSYWDLCLRHQLKKHPHIEPASIEMERNNDVEDLYYYYPMRYGILAQTQLIPDNLPPIEVYVCTRCGFPFKNLNKLHSHVIDCDPAREASSQSGILGKSLHTKKKLLPMMDRRLTQEPESLPSKNRPGKNLKISSLTFDRNKKSVTTMSHDKNMQKISCPPKQNSIKSSPSFSSYYSFDAGSKHKTYDLLYNPQNHARRRELYKVLDQHQCHGCNLKFKSLSMLERHVKKCSGREKLQSQKPLVSQIIPDDAAVRKQHTCRYCNKRFTFIKGVDLHYKRICAVRKVREEENQLTQEDLAHEEELKRIIEHLKWSKTLNKDSSDIIQGHVRVEEDGTLTRLVKERGCPKGIRKNKKGLKSSKQIQNEDDMSLSSSTSSSSQNQSVQDIKAVEDHKPPANSENPCRRLTRSTSLEKVSPVSTSKVSPVSVSGKRKSSSLNSDNMPSRKKTRSSDSFSRDRYDDRKTTESIKNKSRKQSIIPKSRDARVNEARKKSRNAKLNKASSESSSSKGLGNESVRLPARKRGRPQKFDPSDMESSYKKKKKLEALQKQTRAETPKNDSPKLARKTISAHKTQAGVTTSKKTAISETTTRSQRQSPSLPSNKIVKELTSAESSKMMEKMKQLKEAAKLENDNETKLKKAKEAKKVAAKKSSETDLTLNSDSRGKKSSGKSQSSELFKQLTKSGSKVILVKPSSPKQSSPNLSKKIGGKNMSTPSTSNVSTLNNSKRKSSEILHSASPPKKINSDKTNTTACPQPKKTVISSPKKVNLNKLSMSPSESTLSTCNLESKSSSEAVSKMSLLAKSKIPEVKPSVVDDKMSPKSVPLKISTLPTKLTTTVAGSSVESPAVPMSKAQPVCVRVVTLSPNGMNLLTFDSPADVSDKTDSPLCPTPLTKSPEVSTVLPNKTLKTSSVETVQLACKASVSQAGHFESKLQEGNTMPATNAIAIPAPNIPSPSVNSCIKIKKPLNQVMVKTSDKLNLSLETKTSEDNLLLEAVNSISQEGSLIENSPAATTLFTVAKPQGYSILKTAQVAQSLSAEGVAKIVTAPGSKMKTMPIAQSLSAEGVKKFVTMATPGSKIKTVPIAQSLSAEGVTQILTMAAPGSKMKTMPVAQSLSAEGIAKIVTAPGSNLASNQIVLNNPRQKFVKLTSPIQKLKLPGNVENIKLADVQQGHAKPQGSKAGDTVHLISSSSLLSPTSVVTPPISDKKHLVLGSAPNILVSPSPTKLSLAANAVSGLATGTKLRTPASRFASPQPNIIQSNVFAPGTQVLKIGNTVSSTARQATSRETGSVALSKSTVSSNIISTIPEKNVLISALPVPRTTGLGTQPRFSQTVRSTPNQQILTLNTNRNTSRAQPTVIVQHSPITSAQSLHRQPQSSSILRIPTSATVTTVRTTQASVPNSNNYVTSARSAPKQPIVIRQPTSLLTNQIMISLDDGTTAMLDPDSLAQLLSLSPTLNSKTDFDSEISTIVTDPEHVMVNMAEIQPTHQQPTEDISWPANGCVDLTDFSNSPCDL